MSWLQRLFPPPVPAPGKMPDHCDAFAAAKTALDKKVESLQLRPADTDIVGAIINGMRQTGNPRPVKKKNARA